MSNNTYAPTEKEYNDFVYNFLPRFSAHTPMKRGTGRDFLVIAQISSDLFDDLVKGTDKPDKINWPQVLRWFKKWRRQYPNYYDFLKVASRGTLKKN